MDYELFKILDESLLHQRRISASLQEISSCLTELCEQFIKDKEDI